MFKYVIKENKNKKSKDCIAHKLVAGGAYTRGTFIEEVKVLYYINNIYGYQCFFKVTLQSTCHYIYTYNRWLNLI